MFIMAIHYSVDTSRTLCIIFLWIVIYRSNSIQDDVLQSLFHTIGYCDEETTILFQSNLLYPSIPQNRLFYQLPYCSWEELQFIYSPSTSYIQNHSRLNEILKWNSYVFRNRFLPTASQETLPFVHSCLLCFY